MILLLGGNCNKQKGMFIKNSQILLIHMRLCLILLLTPLIALGQSLLTVPPSEIFSQKTNAVLPKMENSILSVETNRLLIYSPSKQYIATDWRMPLDQSEKTNKSVSFLAGVKSFRSIITEVKTNNTTNVNARAIYNQIGTGADKLLIAEKVASVQTNSFDKSTPK
jgi:hypothetical protein